MDILKPTESECISAESSGENAWAYGVSIEGCRAYSDRPHIQKAWRTGWIKAENAQRVRNGETIIPRFFQ